MGWLPFESEERRRISAALRHGELRWKFSAEEFVHQNLDAARYSVEVLREMAALEVENPERRVRWMDEAQEDGARRPTERRWYAIELECDGPKPIFFKFAFFKDSTKNILVVSVHYQMGRSWYQ